MSTREEQKARIERLTREFRKAKSEAGRLLAKERDPRTQRIEGFPAMVKAEEAGSRLLAAIAAGVEAPENPVPPKPEGRGYMSEDPKPKPQPKPVKRCDCLACSRLPEAQRGVIRNDEIGHSDPSQSVEEPGYMSEAVRKLAAGCPCPDCAPDGWKGRGPRVYNANLAMWEREAKRFVAKRSEAPPQPVEVDMSLLVEELVRSMGVPPNLVGTPKPAEPEKPGARWCRLIGAEAELLAADRRLSESKDPSRAAEMFKRLEEASTALMKARFAVEASGDGWRRSVYVSDSEEIRLPMDVTRNQLAALVRELIREGVLAMPELIP